MTTMRSTQPDYIVKTARDLIHAARNATDPHREAVAIVNGLWRGERHPYAQALIAAIEALRPICPGTTRHACTRTVARAGQHCQSCDNEVWDHNFEAAHNAYLEHRAGL